MSEPGAEIASSSSQRGWTRPPRVAVVGMSLRPNCGVRHHAQLLAEALAGAGVACSFHWLQREREAFGPARAEIASWTRALAEELRDNRPDLVLLHYSVFSYSYKGVPIFVRPTLRALRRSGVPVLSVLHEFAYPWMYGGWRGAVWAVSQRVAFIDVMRLSAAAIVTADTRAHWLRSRIWLPARAVLLAPVFSNLPRPGPSSAKQHARGRVGLFGYSYQGAAISLILDAVRELRGRDLGVQLTLLGAPGPVSSSADAWRAAAARRGLADVLSFSGALPAQALSDALAACELLLFADTAGPSGRKGTLAGSLASGRPVVAIDGPMSWRALVEANAVRLAPPNGAGLADAIAGLLSDEGAREELGRRGLDFYEREMSIERTTDVVMGFLERTPAGD